MYKTGLKPHYSVLTCIHTYIHTYIPSIHKFVMATMGCGISHKGTKHADKCSNNKTKTTQEQNDEIAYTFFKIL
jgi:hypothetical protein